MHAAQDILAGFGIEGFHKIALQAIPFKGASLEGLHKQTPVVTKIRKLYQETTWQAAFGKPNGVLPSVNAIFIYQYVH